MAHLPICFDGSPTSNSGCTGKEVYRPWTAQTPWYGDWCHHRGLKVTSVPALVNGLNRNLVEASSLVHCWMAPCMMAVGIQMDTFFWALSGLAPTAKSRGRIWTRVTADAHPTSHVSHPPLELYSTLTSLEPSGPPIQSQAQLPTIRGHCHQVHCPLEEFLNDPSSRLASSRAARQQDRPRHPPAAVSITRSSRASRPTPSGRRSRRRWPRIQLQALTSSITSCPGAQKETKSRR